MRFSKKVIMVVCSLVLMFGMFSNLNILTAAEKKLTIDDIVAMSNEELALVPQTTLKLCLDEFAKLAQDKDTAYRFNEEQFDRVYQQWISNAERETLDSIYDIPLPVTDQIDTLSIGTNTYIYNAEYGYYTTGGAQSLARYDVSLNQQESVTAIVGAGSCYGSAYTGDTFYVEGNSTALANVYVSGYLKALAAMTPSYGYGSSEVKYEMVIEKISGTSNESRTLIHRINGYFQVCDNYFSANTNYYFEPGNWYRITMVVHSAAAWIGLGESLADAFSPSEYAKWYYVNITWL